MPRKPYKPINPLIALTIITATGTGIFYEVGNSVAPDQMLQARQEFAAAADNTFDRLLAVARHGINNPAVPTLQSLVQKLGL